MRLGACLLIPAALTAQSLPWNGAQELPWQAALPGEPPPPLPASGEAEAAKPPCRVSLTGDGALHIVGTQDRILLRLGLAGRPLRLLRDAGTPMTLGDFPAEFPAETPLSRGLGTLPLAGEDFRPALQGLLWIVDDGERVITVVHPATRRVAYLGLPAGQGWEFTFYPDRLQIREKASPGDRRQEPACWTVPWLLLLPQFVRLSVPPPAGTPGTVYTPFPTE